MKKQILFLLAMLMSSATAISIKAQEVTVPEPEFINTTSIPVGTLSVK